MKSFGKYFTYRLKEARTYFLIMTAILSIVAVTANIYTVSYSSDYTNGEILRSINLSSIWGLALLYAVLPFFVSIYEFSGLMNRRNVDTVFFFPIDKWHMTLAHYLTAVITALSSMTVSFSIFYIRVLAKATEEGIVRETFGASSTLPLLSAFLMSLGLMLMSITVISFIFCRANSVIDGFIGGAMWSFVPSLIWLTVERLISSSEIRTQAVGKLIRTIAAEFLIPGWNSLTVIVKFGSIYVNQRSFKEQVMVKGVLIPCAVMLVLAALSFVGMYLLSRRKKAESIGDISDSWFSYKLFIPIYGICIAICMGGADTLILNVFLTVAVLIGYFIYRRGFKLHRSDIVMTVIIAVLSFMEIRF